MSAGRLQSGKQGATPWPTAAQFNEAVQNLHTSVSDSELQGGRAVVGPLGLPLPYLGSTGCVYKVYCPTSGNTWAVKFFNREIPGLAERYREISQFLGQKKLPFLLDFQFLEEGVRIGGAWYPAVKMRWIEGHSLNKLVAQAADQPPLLDQLFDLWVNLASRLRQAGIAHADLEHGNVVLVPKDDRGGLLVKLIDYDGMFVPPLAGKPASEFGHPNYQHPAREQNKIYTAEVDRFSHLTTCCALRCLREGGRPLWERFDSGENMLFNVQDFQNPAQSKLFRELLTLRDAEARSLVGHLALAAQTPPEQTPPIEELLSNGRVISLKPGQWQQVAALLQPQAPLLTARPVVEPPPIAQSVPSITDSAAVIPIATPPELKPAAATPTTAATAVAQVAKTPPVLPTAPRTTDSSPVIPVATPPALKAAPPAPALATAPKAEPIQRPGDSKTKTASPRASDSARAIPIAAPPPIPPAKPPAATDSRRMPAPPAPQLLPPVPAPSTPQPAAASAAPKPSKAAPQEAEVINAELATAASPAPPLLKPPPGVLQGLGGMAKSGIRGVDWVLKTCAGEDNTLLHNFFRLVVVLVLLVAVPYSVLGVISMVRQQINSIEVSDLWRQYDKSQSALRAAREELVQDVQAAARKAFEAGIAARDAFGLLPKSAAYFEGHRLILVATKELAGDRLEDAERSYGAATKSFVVAQGDALALHLDTALLDSDAATAKSLLARLERVRPQHPQLLDWKVRLAVIDTGSGKAPEIIVPTPPADPASKPKLGGFGDSPGPRPSVLPKNPVEGRRVLVGRNLSDPSQVLVRFDSQAGEWRRVANGAELNSGERLFVPPTYRPKIVLNTGVSLTIVGPSLLELLPPDETAVCGLKLEFARVVVENLNATAAPIGVNWANRQVVATLTSRDASLAIEVRSYRATGVDPQIAPSTPIAEMITSRDSVDFAKAFVGTVSLPSGHRRRYIDTQPASIVIDQSMPGWIFQTPLSSVDGLASKSLAEVLAANRSITVNLQEQAQNPNIEMRALACRTLMYLDEFEPFVTALNDERCKSYWSALFDDAQVALARGGASNQKLRQAFQKIRFNEADALYRVLVGYSPEELTRIGGPTLINYLDHAALDFRVLASESLLRITGKSNFYRPELPAATRAGATKMWRDEQQAGRLGYKTNPTPFPAPY